MAVRSGSIPPVCPQTCTSGARQTANTLTSLLSSLQAVNFYTHENNCHVSCLRGFTCPVPLARLDAISLADLRTDLPRRIGPPLSLFIYGPHARTPLARSSRSDPAFFTRAEASITQDHTITVGRLWRNLSPHRCSGQLAELFRTTIACNIDEPLSKSYITRRQYIHIETCHTTAD